MYFDPVFGVIVTQFSNDASFTPNAIKFYGDCLLIEIGDPDYAPAEAYSVNWIAAACWRVNIVLNRK